MSEEVEVRIDPQFFCHNHPILRTAPQTTAFYPLKMGGFKPQFFGKAYIQETTKIITIKGVRT